MVNGEPTNPGGEPFIEPELTPPVHGDKITKPLMGKLMSHDVSDAISIAVCGCLLVEEKGGGTMNRRVRYCHDICLRDNNTNR